jgi:hypothetical protein
MAMGNNTTIIPEETTLDEQRVINAVAKLKEFDPDFVLHLEQLANLAQTNKFLFRAGISFLNKR